jgi:hypothetical protein
MEESTVSFSTRNKRTDAARDTKANVMPEKRLHQHCHNELPVQQYRKEAEDRDVSSYRMHHEVAQQLITAERTATAKEARPIANEKSTSERRSAKGVTRRTMATTSPMVQFVKVVRRTSRASKSYSASFEER